MLRRTSEARIESVSDSSRGLRERWADADSGARYATQRFTSSEKRERDPRLVAALLRQHLPRRADALLLDAPCGAGRLRAALAAYGRTVGLDISPSMLAAGRELASRDLVRGDVERLPFRDRSFDAVISCRLLHHLRERSSLERVVAELVRVSRDLVVASFWDSASLPEWRRAWFPKQRVPRRIARSKAELAEILERAGAEVLGYRHTLRFFSRQAFVVARRRAPAP